MSSAIVFAWRARALRWCLAFVVVLTPLLPAFLGGKGFAAGVPAARPPARSSRPPAKSAPRPDPWLIVPGERVGAITPATSEADLVRLFGADHVTRRPLDTSDATTRPGTIVLGRTLDALEVLWHEDRFLRPERVIVGGGRTRWRTPEGITIGTTLAELVRLNGRPFRLTGFGWEGSGVVTSWEGGRLGARYLPGRSVAMRLGPDRSFGDLSPGEQNAVMGPQEISSSLAALARLGLRVWEIVVLFP